MKPYILTILCAVPLISSAQGATDVFNVSQTELRGTARYMSMAGAFGALGGDMSAINQNPGGIAIYRSSDFSATIDLDAQSARTGSGSSAITTDQVKVVCNNVGYVGAMRFESGALKNINWGFSYNRPVSFNRHYRGKFNSLSTSLTTYIANCTNAEGWKESNLQNYNSNAPWMSVLGYNTYLINPSGGSSSSFAGLMDSQTSASGDFEVLERGYVDEFNLTFGGNVSNVLYWGIGFGVTHIDYRATSYYGESLSEANIYEVVDGEETGETTRGTANYGVATDLHTFGDGYNFKMGIIVKPINELRIGAAFHTPTYYSLTDEYITTASGSFSPTSSDADSYTASSTTNEGYLGESWYKIRTPWKYILSAAAVVGGKGIVSFDYERQEYSGIRYLTNDGREDIQTTEDIKTYYKGSNIFRVGAEYRLTKQFSLRVGYSHQDSPVKSAAYNNQETIYTSSVTPAYTFDKSTEYITCGIGYRYDCYYVDFAYVHKSKKGEYHAFSPYDGEESPTTTLKSSNNRFALTLGVRF